MTTGADRPTVRWIDGGVEIDGILLSLDVGVTPDPTRFHLRKPPHMIRRSLGFAERMPDRRVVELGIAGGGSIVLYLLAGRPARLLGLERSPNRLPALDRFLAHRELTERVDLRFGLDQADRPAVHAAVDDHFGAAPIDLVIDDASHLLGPTTASFETLFPRIEPGGEYIVEDWRWHHMRRRRIAEHLGIDRASGSDELTRRVEAAIEDPTSPDHERAVAAISAALERADDPQIPRPFDETDQAPLTDNSEIDLGTEPPDTSVPGDPPLSTLGVQCLLAKACGSKAIDHVVIEDHWLRIVRGPSPLKDGWRLADEYTDFDGLLPELPAAD